VKSLFLASRAVCRAIFTKIAQQSVFCNWKTFWFAQNVSMLLIKSSPEGNSNRGERMRKYCHGVGRPWFEGWYLKCQTWEGKALALIPAVHMDGAGRWSASFQVITEGDSWWLEYPDTEFRVSERLFQVHLGPNLFRQEGTWLDVEREGLSLHGALRFGPFAPLQSDIMGPFRLLANMECAHGVLSMGHTLEGKLILNGETMDFSGGMGYIETDRGRSFPSAYLWTQCAWRESQPGGLMLAIAAIPLGIVRFTGCICAVCYGGREYRLATYRGARAVEWSKTGAVIRQGKYRLTVKLLEGKSLPLRAPVEGNMGRTIHERLCAKVRYRFWAGEILLFDHTDCSAGFEYAEERSSHGESAAT